MGAKFQTPLFFPKKSDPKVGKANFLFLFDFHPSDKKIAKIVKFTFMYVFLTNKRLVLDHFRHCFEQKKKTNVATFVQ